MNIGRDAIWLVTVHHRDRTVRQAFLSERGADEWLKDRRSREAVIQHQKETVWLNP